MEKRILERKIAADVLSEKMEECKKFSDDYFYYERWKLNVLEEISNLEYFKGLALRISKI
ncbi:hypothetical protein D3C81_1959370 [compost metagenome]